jgi:hypothetical protein
MFSKALPARAIVIAVVLIVGAGTATAAAAVSIGGGAPSSVAPTHSNDSPTDASSDKAGSNAAAPHTAAATVTSGPSQRQGNGPNVHALPGLCRAQIASAGHPNAHSVVSSVNCSGVTPAGSGSPDSSPTSSASSADGPSNGAPGSADGTQGTGGAEHGHGRP